MQLCEMAAALVYYLDDLLLLEMGAVQLLEMGGAQFFLGGYCTVF